MALEAAARAVKMTRLDSKVFRAINQGDAKWSVLEVLSKAFVELSEIETHLLGALEKVEPSATTESGRPIRRRRRYRDAVVHLLFKALDNCRATVGLYRAIERATLCLKDFEAWRSTRPGSVRSDRSPIQLATNTFRPW